MNRLTALAIVTGVVVLGLAPLPGRAQGSQLSPERLNMVDQLGYFTPEFKAAVHDLVDSKRALAQATAEKKALILELPDLQTQATDTEAKAIALRAELAKYDHPEETDFTALQKQMNDTTAKPDDLIALAQAYVWTYPASPHTSEAQQYLLQMRNKMADQRRAEIAAAAARAAAWEKMVQRAQARDLSLGEWRDFLRDMSEDDVVKYLGRSTFQREDYWTYSGPWITDATSGQKVGMAINFNAGRVISVSEQPSTQ